MSSLRQEAALGVCEELKDEALGVIDAGIEAEGAREGEAVTATEAGLYMSAAAVMVAAGGWALCYLQHRRSAEGAAEDRGKAAQRISDLGRWRQVRSVERSQFEGWATRRRCRRRRARGLQVGGRRGPPGVADARLVGLGDLMKAQGDALSHQMRNTRMALEGR